jgi:hypothetical protein
MEEIGIPRPVRCWNRDETLGTSAGARAGMKRDRRAWLIGLDLGHARNGISVSACGEKIKRGAGDAINCRLTAIPFA